MQNVVVTRKWIYSLECGILLSIFGIKRSNNLKKIIMEIVNIDSKTFEAMLSTFEGFASRMESLCRLHGDKELSEWLDNQDVCLLLNISPRTLQTFRDNGTLPFSRINHKIYYKSSDVGKITSVVEEKRKQVKYRGKKL